MAPRAERKLAAILAVDVVGYSRLVGADEAGTLARFKAHRVEFTEPLITEHRGRVVKLTGDGALVEFDSAVDAVECAVAIQKGMAEREAGEPEDRRIRYRIGINIGDIVHDEGDIFGDGVNIATRIEGLADPGGICIARNVHNQVKGKLNLAFEPMGAHQVKNIAEPVEVWRVGLGPGVVVPSQPAWAQRRWQAAAAAVALLLVLGAGGAWYALWRSVPAPDAAVEEAVASEDKPALPLPDKPSIAVLPFDNLSGEERYERLADGLTEDIITDLSAFPELFVIARNSTFFYKGKPTDVRQIARELGVQYVLEGSLQAEAERVRITAQLIDASTANHIWSERYDRALDDVFAVQDEVTEQIVGTLGGYWGRLAEAGRQIARRKSPENMKAYDLYLLATEYKARFTKEDNKKAQEMLNQAITLDPTFARAYVVLAQSLFNDAAYGLGDNPARSLGESVVAAKKAVALDDADGMAHHQLAVTYFYEHEIERGAGEFRRALALGENDADVLAVVGYNRPTKLPTGEEDVDLVKRAMRLNPHYPEWYLYALGYAAYHGRQYEEAIDALKPLADRPVLDGPLYLALSYVQLGHDSEAAAEAAKVLQIVPDFSAETLIENDAFRDPGVIEHFLDSVRKTGLPLCATEAQLAGYPDLKPLEECEQQRASG